MEFIEQKVGDIIIKNYGNYATVTIPFKKSLSNLRRAIEWLTDTNWILEINALYKCKNGPNLSINIPLSEGHLEIAILSSIPFTNDPKFKKLIGYEFSIRSKDLPFDDITPLLRSTNQLK